MGRGRVQLLTHSVYEEGVCGRVCIAWRREVIVLNSVRISQMQPRFYDNVNVYIIADRILRIYMFTLRR